MRIQAVWLHCSPAEEGHCRAPEDISGVPPPVDEEESGGAGSSSSADGVCLGPFDCQNVRTVLNGAKFVISVLDALLKWLKFVLFCSYVASSIMHETVAICC